MNKRSGRGGRPEFFRSIKRGGVAQFAAVKHWHGSTATTAMSHIAIQEALDGKVVDWMEKGHRRGISGRTGVGIAEELEESARCLMSS
jgi:hypothetical protein